jgi:hypothetical protein
VRSWRPRSAPRVDWTIDRDVDRNVDREKVPIDTRPQRPPARFTNGQFKDLIDVPVDAVIVVATLSQPEVQPHRGRSR